MYVLALSVYYRLLRVCLGFPLSLLLLRFGVIPVNGRITSLSDLQQYVEA